MKFSTNPPLHLSNHEVLLHFLDLKKDNDTLLASLAQRKARKRQAAEEMYPPDPRAWKGREETPVELEEWSEEKERDEDVAERRGACEELVWVQDKVIRYLCSDHNPTIRQTEAGVALLADQLQDHGLTKAEVLQLCNLAPSRPVELYCVIEEVDLRFQPDTEAKLHALASQITATILPHPPEHLLPYYSTTNTEGLAGSGTADEVSSWRDTEMLEEEQGMEEEYVHEAEWGRDKEGAVDDEPGGDMD